MRLNSRLIRLEAKLRPSRAMLIPLPEESRECVRKLIELFHMHPEECAEELAIIRRITQCA